MPDRRLLGSPASPPGRSRPACTSGPPAARHARSGSGTSRRPAAAGRCRCFCGPAPTAIAFADPACAADPEAPAARLWFVDDVDVPSLTDEQPASSRQASMTGGTALWTGRMTILHVEATAEEVLPHHCPVLPHGVPRKGARPRAALLLSRMVKRRGLDGRAWADRYPAVGGSSSAGDADPGPRNRRHASRTRPAESITSGTWSSTPFKAKKNTEITPATARTKRMAAPSTDPYLPCNLACFGRYRLLLLSGPGLALCLG